MFIVDSFCNTIVSAQWNMHIIQILCRVPPERVFLEGIFCLCVENVVHVLDPFFFKLSHGVGRLFTYKVSVVTSGQIGFALKIALKCTLSKVYKIAYISGG